jgi:hypothetical protein
MPISQSSNLAQVSGLRLRPDTDVLLDSLGLLQHLPGTWIGTGFNLIARPQFAPIDGQNSDFFLQISLTQEILRFDLIRAAIPNRGLMQNDINLFGLHYLQQISDALTFGALHLEPGLWITMPTTTQPDAPLDNMVARLASIPHGTALVAQGQALEVPPPKEPIFTPANTTPFLTAANTPVTFPEFDLSQPSVFRSPLPPPSAIDPAKLQAAVKDPNTLLKDAIVGQQILNTVVINIATAPSITVGGTTPATTINTPNGGGGTANIDFLKSTKATPSPPAPPPPPQHFGLPNADAVQVFATFWIEEIQNPFGAGTFFQLQYSQTVHLNFNTLTWPHVSVATLVRSSVV